MRAIFVYAHEGPASSGMHGDKPSACATTCRSSSAITCRCSSAATITTSSAVALARSIRRHRRRRRRVAQLALRRPRQARLPAARHHLRQRSQLRHGRGAAVAVSRLPQARRRHAHRSVHPVSASLTTLPSRSLLSLFGRGGLLPVRSATNSSTVAQAGMDWCLLPRDRGGRRLPVVVARVDARLLGQRRNSAGSEQRGRVAAGKIGAAQPPTKGCRR